MSASERDLLMIPGPSQVDPSVMRAMMKTTESHMSEPFGLRYRSVLDKLKKIDRVFILFLIVFVNAYDF